MPEAPVIVNGMPLIAVVNAGKGSDGPWGPGEYWEELEALYWRKRDGTRGKPVSEALFDKLHDQEDVICEQVWDWLRYEQYVWDCAENVAPLLYQGGVQDNQTIDGCFRFDT